MKAPESFSPLTCVIFSKIVANSNLLKWPQSVTSFCFSMDVDIDINFLSMAGPAPLILYIP